MPKHPEQLSGALDELAARADAAQKLALQSLEFLNNLAATQGKVLDFSGAAIAMENPAVIALIPAQNREIEVRSRSIAADLLMQFAAATKANPR